MSMIARPFTVLALNEAEVTHGKTITINMNSLPPIVKQRMKEQLKEAGVSEKEFEGRMKAEDDFAKENVPIGRNSYNITDQPVSIHGNDAIEGHIMHELENYDKALDEAILNSDNIVKAYNATIDAKFDEALAIVKKQSELEAKYANMSYSDIKNQKDVQDMVYQIAHKGLTLPVALLESITAEAGEMKEHFGLTDSDIKKMVCEAAYQPSDDPEQIKKIVNARIKYNDTIIAFFKDMLQINYNLLGLSKDEALALSDKLSSSSHETTREAIKDVKSIIVKNADKYKIGKTSYDFRPLGLGCMFMTEEDVGPIESTVNIDRMIQMLTQYDAIVVGHGSSGSDDVDHLIKKTMEEYDRTEEQYREKEEKERKEYDKQISKLIDSEIESTPEGKAFLKRYEEAKNLFFMTYYDTDTYKQFRKQIDDIYNQHDLPYETCKEMVAEIQKQSDAAREEYSKVEEKYKKEYDKLFDEYWDIYRRDAKSRVYTGKAHNEELNELGRKCTEISSKLDQERHEADERTAKVAIRTYKKLREHDKVSWHIQPVKTLHGGPYTDVNDLVRQLIKEGFKNINLISCNPGRHTLAKDILDTKGVKIHHSNTSLLAENVTYYDSGNVLIEDAFSEIDKSLKATQQHLLSICESSGICYYDDTYLDECTMFFESGNASEVLTEGVLATAWAKLKELISKALGFIVNIFKKLLSLAAGLIKKIKEFFKKIFGSDRVDSKMSRSVSSGVIMVESARLNRSKVNTWEEMQRNVVSACEKITKKIEETERKQTTNMQQLEKYAESQSKKVNESASPEMNKILEMLW